MKEPGRYQEETEDSHKTREIPDHHTSNDRGFPYRQVQKNNQCFLRVEISNTVRPKPVIELEIG